jgi:hypothetical protein
VSIVLLHHSNSLCVASVEWGVGGRWVVVEGGYQCRTDILVWVAFCFSTERKVLDVRRILVGNQQMI